MMVSELGFRPLKDWDFERKNGPTGTQMRASYGNQTYAIDSRKGDLSKNWIAELEVFIFNDLSVFFFFLFFFFFFFFCVFFALL